MANEVKITVVEELQEVKITINETIEEVRVTVNEVSGKDAPKKAIFECMADPANTSPLPENEQVFDSWGSPEIIDTGYSFIANELSLGATLVGRRARIESSVGGCCGNNRAQLNVWIERFNGNTWDKIKLANNYIARDNDQDEGCVYIYKFVTIVDGDKFRVLVQTVEDGAQVTERSPLATSFSMITID
ncbi:MAG: hypothetical protein S4CHLAM20_04450 [Chlamydiia bacterium]|nr:hypothetical protein [Chlamydiia bacterium]